MFYRSSLLDGACLLFFSAALSICDCTSPDGSDESIIKFNVLIVVDMQKDYDSESNKELYGYKKNTYAHDVSLIVPAINEIRLSRDWDKVIFTKDWLSPDVFSFCQIGSKGAELLDALRVDEDKDFYFTKNHDDAFNTDHESWGFGYGLQQEGERIGADSNKLADILLKFGYTPLETSITFVGQMIDRCVLKSAVHAKSLGYTVSVEQAAIATSQMEPVDWDVPTTATDPKDIYHSKGGPGMQQALSYMTSFGITIVKPGTRHIAIPKRQIWLQSFWLQRIS